MAAEQLIDVLHVNNVDLPGRRFNGYDLITDLRPYGIRGTQAVLTRLSRSPDVVSLWRSRADESLHQVLEEKEWRLCMNNLLFPWGRVMMDTPAFRRADVVHYHLLHNHVVSLFDLPRLFARRPSVWTFHDPWPMTGHCIYPRTCQKWLTGCSGCPDLDAWFPLRADCADRMWRVKQRVYRQLDADIVVASPHMLDLVRRSPLTAHFERVHLIPFGIDVDRYYDDGRRLESRALLGVPADDFVLFFRETSAEAKGMQYILEALRRGRPTRPTTLLTVDQKGLLGSLSKEYGRVELGWVDDEERLARALSACDALLMPSTAEAFGLMAIEAMAAGRPVVCFEDTALPTTSHAPECGIAVPLGDASALRDAIDRLAGDPEEARRRGALGREIAREHYDHRRYLSALAALYRDVAARGA